MPRRTLGIFIGAEQKGFLISLGETLSKDHNVWFLATDRDVRRVILDKAPELSERVIVLDEHRASIDPERVVEESLAREEKYGEKFSMLMSSDRALGQGYLFNADRHPHVIRSMWPYTRKLKELLESFLMYEKVYETHAFDLLLGHGQSAFLDLIARHYGTKYLTLGLSRYADRYIWYENVHEEKEAYRKAVRKYRNADGNGGWEIRYEQYHQYTYTAGGLDYSYWNAFKRATLILAQQVYIRLRRAQQQDSYVFGGWIPPILRSPANYRYVLRYGVKPDQMGRYRLIYFPLHQEPESSLLNVSPEFNNSMEIIAWVCKSLPADAALVVKENPWSFGVRSRRYYRNLVKIPNAFLAHPEVSSLEWIQKSKGVVTITGTAGFEAVYFERPVLSYGKHQIINDLPTVRYADSFFSTRDAIQDLLAIRPDDERFERSRYSLHKALMDVSFPIPGYEKNYKSSKLHPEMAEIAAARLYEEYPGILGQP